MPDPVITSASLDKAAYSPGETMVLTVSGSDPDEEIITVEFKLRTTSGESVPQTLQVTIDELTAEATDSGLRTWTLQGRTGDTFILTATA
jgi:hypothetical protein